MSRTKLLLVLTTVSVLLPAWSFAQDAGSLLKQQEQQPPGFPAQLPDSGAETALPAFKPANGVKVLITEIRFTGAVDLVPEAKLAVVVADAIDKELGFADLEKIAQRVTAHLKAHGWFLARAYLPRQELTDGILEIALLAGRLDSQAGQPYDIVPVGKIPLRIDAARLAAIAGANLRAGAAAREVDIERTVLLMNDLPGISAKARLEPGSEADSTRIAIDVQEGPLLSANIGLNNAGNRNTGTVQLNGQLQVNDPMHQGDQFSIGFTNSQGLDLGQMGYTLPVGASGTKVGLNLSRMIYDYIRGAGLTAGLSGEATTWGMMASHPFVRSRTANLSLSGGYAQKRLKDDSSAGNLNDKDVHVSNLALSGDHFDSLGGGAFSYGNLGYTSGRLDLSGNSANAAADAGGYATQGDYHKWTWGLGRLQKLPGAFNLYANLNGQIAGGNLDSSEQFILGGAYGVRSYPVSEASGDSGWLANLELRYDLPSVTPLGQWQLVSFYDTGHITQHDDPKALPITTATGNNSYDLSGWGLGVNLTKNGSHNVKLAWARKIGSNPGRSVAGLDADERDDKSRLWLNGTLFF